MFSVILGKSKGLFVQGVKLALVCCEVYGNESIPPLRYFSIPCLVFYMIAGYSSFRLMLPTIKLRWGYYILRCYRGYYILRCYRDLLSGSTNMEDLI